MASSYGFRIFEATSLDDLTEEQYQVLVASRLDEMEHEKFAQENKARTSFKWKY